MNAALKSILTRPGSSILAQLTGAPSLRWLNVEAPKVRWKCCSALLKALEKMDPRKAQVIELRFFGGLTVEETAEVLKVSADTVMGDWKLARAWLMTELSGGE